MSTSLTNRGCGSGAGGGGWGGFRWDFLALGFVLAFFLTLCAMLALGGCAADGSPRPLTETEGTHVVDVGSTVGGLVGGASGAETGAVVAGGIVAVIGAIGALFGAKNRSRQQTREDRLYDEAFHRGISVGEIKERSSAAREQHQQPKGAA